MDERTTVKTLQDVVIRFSGDSGDGMQLTGTIFSDLSAMLGNTISTFPDFPAEIRAPQGTLSGVSGYQVHIGSESVRAPGDYADVLVAMNAAALKANQRHLRRDSVIIIDSDSFGTSDLKKAEYETDNPFEELGFTTQQVLSAPITTMVKDRLTEFGLDNKSAVRCKNMFALGLICWLFDRPLQHAEAFLDRKFGKKPAIRDANVKALNDGFNFGANTHASTTVYRIETQTPKPGKYLDINGNKATAYGLIAAAEQAGLDLFLGSYPITPATDILHELAKHKALGVKTVQAEDEIAGICTAIGAAFAGDLAVTTTSGPGLALKSEAMGLTVIAELPLVIVDVQRAGPSTGMPTKSEQTDLLQALYGRNGESPMPVLAATTPADCFDMAYWAAKIALEHLTPVILLTDSFIANGSSVWRIPEDTELLPIKPHTIDLRPEQDRAWKAYERDETSLARYWAIPGTEGYAHRLGGLEKDYHTSVISTDPDNHELMVRVRAEKIAKIANKLPPLEIEGDSDPELLIVGWGGTYGHLYETMEAMRARGLRVALAQFRFINPLPHNTEEVLRRHKKVIVAEQNSGQFASYLRGLFPGFSPLQYNRVTGQPFVVEELTKAFSQIIEK
ncbi:MAG: 2-oxoacid:acceptor oxidoreductase subunit alpha [Porphyromonadaceae bacterium]|nr:2-oxoacid:acceptor oxidoreductase subunit alpha [Porphyromonadaceae bacterium]